jgi:hypothetical protein
MSSGFVAAVLVAGTLFVGSPATAADPESIPCSPGSCEPAPPCDAQAFVNLGQQLSRAESRADRLEEKVANRDAVIDRLRRKLARANGWR